MVDKYFEYGDVFADGLRCVGFVEAVFDEFVVECEVYVFKITNGVAFHEVLDEFGGVAVSFDGVAGEFPVFNGEAGAFGDFTDVAGHVSGKGFPCHGGFGVLFLLFLFLKVVVVDDVLKPVFGNLFV